MFTTIEQLEAYVSSPAYDARAAGLLALGIPALKAATGQPGELLEPGVRRIRGNLCNVHGKYGPCDKGAAGKKKPAKGRKPPAPKKTDAQRAQERAASQATRQAETTRQQALNMTKVGEATGLEDHLANLDQFSQGKPLRPQDEATLIEQGLMERGADGTARMSEQGRVLVNAAKRGDVQRARDAQSRGRDQVSAAAGRATARQERVTAAEGRKRETEAKRQQREAERVKRETDRKRGASAAGKKPEAGAEKPLRSSAPKRLARNSAPAGGGGSSSAPKPKPKPKPAKPEQPSKEQAAASNRGAVRQAMADADQGLAPGGFDNLIALGAGTEPDEIGAAGLISMGMAERGADGTLRLTSDARAAITAANRGDAKAAIDAVSRGQERASTRKKASSFRVFKDAAGRDRWVAQSSTAFQDRDKEIVSTKALADDVAYADAHGSYGPLRWWHTPGLDLGQCDFNAMHGRILIESGTFRSPAIAQKVAAAASGLEISLGFVHLPSEPDADGVFHHIRRFERSLVPRGKASNRFTAFTVKERPMFDPTKVAALKQLGFSDEDITGLQTQAEATEKAATDQGVAYKADDTLELPDLEINGVIYKAFPPKAAAATEAAAPVAVEDVIEEDAFGEPPMDEEPAAGGLTLSPEDIAAIGSAVAEQIGPAIAQVMGALDLEKKVAGHVQTFLAPYQATKDAEAAEAKEQIQALATKVQELSGDQAATPYRASAAKDSVLTDATMLAAAKQLTDPNGNDPWADIKLGLGLSRPQ